MGSLSASLWFNSTIALIITPMLGKGVEILTKGDPDTMSNFMKMIKNNDMIVVSGLLFLISYIVAILGNVSASSNKYSTEEGSTSDGCGQVDYKSALFNSLKVSVFVWIGFMLGVMVPFFQEPWINLLAGAFEKVPGLAEMVPYIVGGFVAMCLSWLGTALSHFSYMQDACKPNDANILQGMKGNSDSSDSSDSSDN